jgi:L-Ala-D/L-Glu epimerase
MKITQVTIYKYTIPMIPFAIATGIMDCTQNIYIEVETDAKIIGVGECSAFPMIAGETQATCFELAKAFAKLWIGKNALEIADRLAELDFFIAGNYTAKSAFDLALHDLAAQFAHLPLYKYLGGNKKNIESDLTIGLDSSENMAQKAASFVAKGVNIIKVKLGKNPAEDIERVTSIRKAIGTSTKIRIDANQGWTYEEACHALKGLAELNIEFCEQPMRKYNDYLLPQLKAISPIALMADESVFTHQDAAQLIRNNACHYINIKFAKSGGIAEAKRVHDIAAAAGIPCMLGGMLESRVALTAKVHFAMAMPNIVFYDLDTCLLGHLEDPVEGGVQYADGMHLQLNDCIGIGAVVNKTWLQNAEQCIVAA